MKNITDAIAQHDLIARTLLKKLLVHGNENASGLISHTVDIIDNEAILKTSIEILPIRRIYKQGTKITDDDRLTYESAEDWII